MTISLPPEVQRFVEDKVKSGEFPDPTSVVVGAIENMRAQEQLEQEEPGRVVGRGGPDPDSGTGEDLNPGS